MGTDVEESQVRLVNANSYYYKAQLTGCGEGDDFFHVILGEGAYCCK